MFLPATPARQAHAKRQPYGAVGALLVGCIAAIGIATYLGMARVSSSSLFFGLEFLQLILVFGLAYVLLTLHSALRPKDASDYAYGLVGALVVLGLAVVILVASLSGVGSNAFTARGALFALGFMDLVLGLGICYVLFTLRAGLADHDHDDRLYPLVGALVIIGVAVVATLAYMGAVGLAFLATETALIGLAAVEFVLAVGLCYVLFTLRRSITALRLARASRPQEAAVEETAEILPMLHVPRRPTMTAVAWRPVRSTPAAGPWRSLPRRNSQHAVHAHGTPAIEIEGIGPEYAARLRVLGIMTTGDVKAADPDVTARAIDVPSSTFLQWQSMADLMEVSGIGKQYSEVLVRSGIRSVDELARSNASDVWAATRRTERTNLAGTPRASRIQGTHLKVGRIKRWVAEAKLVA